MPAAWALTASQAFIDAPVNVFPTIDRLTRLDMIDYFNSGSQKPSKNSFKGDCRILTASESQITVSTSEVSEVSLSLIPQKSDTIIMVITTLKTPADDSNSTHRPGRKSTKGCFSFPSSTTGSCRKHATGRTSLKACAPLCWHGSPMSLNQA